MKRLEIEQTTVLLKGVEMGSDTDIWVSDQKPQYVVPRHKASLKVSLNLRGNFSEIFE